MLHVVLSALFLLVATSVRAEWVKVTESQGAVVYVDPATLKKSGDVRRVWILTDLQSSRGDNVVSIRTLEDFNCKQRRRRITSQVSYAGPMATGKVLHSARPTSDKFEQVSAFTPQYEYVCGL